MTEVVVGTVTAYNPTVMQKAGERALLNWRTSTVGLCGLIVVICGTLTANGVTGHKISLVGAVAMAVSLWAAKDK